tara:strand:- start:1804 stop:2496 length:693 start_codon:yes stop_codon:yes gene_type:complete
MKFKTPIGRIGSDIWANIRLKAVIREVGQIRNKKILDIGCETAPYIGESFIKNNDVTFTDLLQESLERVKHKNCKKVKLDLTKPNKLKEQSFDMIVCADVMEHIENEKLALTNLLKLLKKNGILIFTAPAYQKFYGIHDKKIGHFRRYDKSDIKRIAEEHNLKTIRTRHLVSLILPLFIIAQRTKKSESLYENKSELEKKIIPLLNLFCEIDERLNLPFGICIMAIFRKN